METKQEDLALISADELSLAETNNLNAEQLKRLLSKTPPQYVKERPAKGGGKWKYVTGGYIKKCLNLMFGWDWDFEIISEQILHDEAIVKGKLTCRSNGKTIVKMQYGNKDVVYKKELVEGKKIPLSIGNDYKSAATDCLKKCASEIGLAADIYNADEFKEINVDTEEKKAPIEVPQEVYDSLLLMTTLQEIEKYVATQQEFHKNIHFISAVKTAKAKLKK